MGGASSKCGCLQDALEAIHSCTGKTLKVNRLHIPDFCVCHKSIISVEVGIDFSASTSQYNFPAFIRSISLV